jgi:hypothetical protein
MTSALRLVLGGMVVLSTLVARVASAGEFEPPEGSRDRVVLCESRNYRRAYCPSPTPLEQVVVTQVVSGSACLQGATWGFDRNGVWVDGGCRAYFRLITEGSPQQTVINITCSSWNSQYAQCDTGLRVLSVNLAVKHSNAACIQGVTWGVQGDSLWVSAGCRATFSVSGTRRQ